MGDKQTAGHDAVFDIDVSWQPIAPQARLVWSATATLVAAIPLSVIVAIGAAVGDGLGALFGVLLSVGTIALLWWLVGRRYRAWGYGLRDEELVIRRGLLIRRLTIVPVGRMQFIDIHQGPLDRWLGVATLQLHTAAAASDAKIPMLVLAEAGRLRDELTTRGAERSGGT